MPFTLRQGATIHDDALMKMCGQTLNQRTNPKPKATHDDGPGLRALARRHHTADHGTHCLAARGVYVGGGGSTACQTAPWHMWQHSIDTLMNKQPPAAGERTGG